MDNDNDVLQRLVPLLTNGLSRVRELRQMLASRGIKIWVMEADLRDHNIVHIVLMRDGHETDVTMPRLALNDDLVLERIADIADRRLSELREDESEEPRA